MTQVEVKKKLDKFLQEFQDGKHEGSVITNQTVESLSTDEKQTWHTIRKELEDIGITVAAFDANKDFIMNWFKVAIATGAFEEQTLGGTDEPSTSVKTQHMQVTQKAPRKAPTRRGCVPLVAALVAWVFRYDKELINAASQGQGAVVQRLLKKGADVNAKNMNGQTALRCAADKGRETVVRLLLEKGADVNAKDKNG
jgi:ankyrin repeat protein